MNTWIPGRYLLDGGDGFKTISTGFFLASCNWEGKGVDDDVFNPHVPLRNQVIDQSGSNPNFIGLVSGLPLFVDGQRDNGCTVLLY